MPVDLKITGTVLALFAWDVTVCEVTAVGVQLPDFRHKVVKVGFNFAELLVDCLAALAAFVGLAASGRAFLRSLFPAHPAFANIGGRDDMLPFQPLGAGAIRAFRHISAFGELDSNDSIVLQGDRKSGLG